MVVWEGTHLIVAITIFAAIRLIPRNAVPVNLSPSSCSFPIGLSRKCQRVRGGSRESLFTGEIGREGEEIERKGEGGS